jgi:pantoate--beta-alanine ligase
MVEDLNVPVRVQGCPTVREADGLAMSSRNRFLTEQQRHAALSLWRSLQTAKHLFDAGERNVHTLEKSMSQQLLQNGVDRIEYARVVDANSLATMETVSGPAVALIAAYVGTTRLIDNLVLA